MSDILKAKTIDTTHTIERRTVFTGQTYEKLITSFEAELRRLDAATIKTLVESKAPWHEVEKVIQEMAGWHGLMIIGEAKQGAITSLSGKPKRCALYLIGNPVVANTILDVDVRGCFYVPFRVCLFDDRDPRGAAICYDRPTSFLKALDSPEVGAVGKQLEAKMDGLVNVLMKPAT